jgi:hypothetical protein
VQNKLSQLLLSKYLNKNYSVTGFPNSQFQWWVEGAVNFSGPPSSAITVNWDLEEIFGKPKLD